jgi:plasmid stability protein
MEAELRAILQAELAGGARPEEIGLASAIRRRFAPLGGVDLPDFTDEPVREPPDFA